MYITACFTQILSYIVEISVIISCFIIIDFVVYIFEGRQVLSSDVEYFFRKKLSQWEIFNEVVRKICI